MSAAQNESAAWPKAEDPALVQELLDCVQQASHYRQLKKGAVSWTILFLERSRGIPEAALANRDCRTRRPSRMSTAVPPPMRSPTDATRRINRGTSELVILAADTQPLSIVLHIPLISEEKNVPYVVGHGGSDTRSERGS